MFRRFAVAALIVAAAAVRVTAQDHPGHPAGHPHDPAHASLDSAAHAALHALLHGTWTGTMTSAHGSAALRMSLNTDSLHKAMIAWHTEHGAQMGSITQFAMAGDTLRWTQDVSGSSCQASAVLGAASPKAPATLNGSMSCKDGESRFTLTRER